MGVHARAKRLGGRPLLPLGTEGRPRSPLQRRPIYSVCLRLRLAANSAFPRDGCLVEAAPFAELVRDHVNRWKADHPSWGRERDENGYFDGLSDDSPIQALVWLSATASHLADPDGEYLPRLLVPRGLLERLVSGRRMVLELRVADAICLALDAPYVMAGIEVIPNPDASAKERALCCAGSEREDVA
jgi:hypothetical protein